jgi:phage shock protein A
MPTREEMQSLTHDIVRSYKDRITGIAELREMAKEVREKARTDLKEFRDSWAATGKELRADLAKSVADRKRDVSAILRGFDAEIKEPNRTRAAMSTELKADLSRSAADLKRDIASMVKGFDEAHAAMSKELKADLARSAADRKRDVGAVLKGFDAELKEVRGALARARDEWQKLNATMQAKRGGLVTEVKPPEAVAPHPPHVEVIAKEEAVARAEATPESAALQERVFEYLANHPDGRRLVELEQEFGVARIQMARVLKDLINQNRVQKREGVYFAI